MTIKVTNLSFEKEKRTILLNGVTFASFGIPINFKIEGEELEKPLNFTFTCLFDVKEGPCVAKFESPTKEDLNIKFYNPGIGLNMPDSALGIEILPDHSIEFIFALDIVKTNTRVYKLSYEFYLIKK